MVGGALVEPETTVNTHGAARRLSRSAPRPSLARSSVLVHPRGGGEAVVGHLLGREPHVDLVLSALRAV